MPGAQAAKGPELGASGVGAVGDGLRTLAGFAIIGFANTLLPFLAFATSYLIIPFSRPSVLLIELLPAIAVKLLVPYVFHRVPYILRVPGFVVVWSIVAFVISVSPPNVEPPGRVIMCLLASATAAATDIMFLGMLRYYGKVGLVGWGLGTGIGGIVCAVLPYVVTYGMGLFIRDVIGYIYYMAVVLLLAYFAMLPKAPRMSKKWLNSSDDAEDIDTSLVIQDAPLPPPTMRQRAERHTRIAASLVSPCMVPLGLAIGAQALLYPGSSRALGISSHFETFSSYIAGYGLCYQLGNALARCSILFIRVQDLRTYLIRVSIVIGISLLNALFLVTSMAMLIFPLMFVLGVLVGAVYINTFAMAMENGTLKHGPDREFGLGVIGVGESLGLLVGGLVGSMLEGWMCGLGEQRWCHTVR